MSLQQVPPPVPSRARVRGQRFVLVASRVNEPLTRALVRGATGALEQAGAIASHIRVLWVPGAFELPVAAARAVRSRPRPDAVIALGVLIRGETVQYEVLANAVAQGLTQVSVSSAIPVTFGVVVALTLAQARARSGGRMGNRGAEAALAALAVLRLFERLK